MKYLALVDRDGTINVDKNLISKIEDIELIENADKGIAILNKAGVYCVIVSNQPVIARGLCTVEELEKINEQVVNLLSDKGAKIDAFFYCPHHPEKQWGGNMQYRIECDCRKPKPGMLKIAAEKFGIDPSNCFMIGDNTRDILAGKSFGCKTILVLTGNAGKDGKYDVKPDYICNNLYEAAKLILKIVA